MTKCGAPISADGDARPSGFVVRGLTVEYAGRTILHSLSLQVRSGELVGILGPNGSGKSTLLRAIAGTIPSKGEILTQGHNIASLLPHERARRGVRYVPQSQAVFGNLSVEENVRIALSTLPVPQRHERREAMGIQFPIVQSHRHKVASSLSSGERQQVALAIALAVPAQILLLDEPLAGLSPVAAVATLAMIREQCARQAFACLIVEHSAQAVSRVDRAYLLQDGRILAEAASDELSDEHIWTAYYGPTKEENQLSGVAVNEGEKREPME